MTFANSLRGLLPIRPSTLTSPMSCGSHTPLDGVVESDTAHCVSFSRAGIGQDPIDGGFRNSRARSGGGGERHAGLSVPKMRQRRRAADNSVRRDRHGFRPKAERTKNCARCSTPATGAALRPAVACARQEYRNRRDQLVTPPSLWPGLAGCRTDDPSRSIIIRMRRRAREDRSRSAARSRADKARPCGGAWPDGPPPSSTRQPRPDRRCRPGVEDRNADMWEPLLRSPTLPGQWPKRAREAAVALVKVARDEEPSLGLRLLADLAHGVRRPPPELRPRILKELCASTRLPGAISRGSRSMRAASPTICARMG